MKFVHLRTVLLVALSLAPLAFLAPTAGAYSKECTTATVEDLVGIPGQNLACGTCTTPAGRPGFHIVTPWFDFCATCLPPEPTLSLA